MKNISILEARFTNKNQRFIERLKSSLSLAGFNITTQNYSNIKSKNPLTKIFKINKLAKKQKDDKFYICLDGFDSADIYLASNGAQKIYKKLDKFWFLNPVNFAKSIIEKRCVENSKKIVANSNLTRYQLETIYNLQPDKITTIYPGINLPTQIQKGSAKMQLCSELGIDMELPIILFISDDFKKDGAREFIELLSHLDNRANALIIGDSNDIPKYKKLAKSLEVRAVFKSAPKILNRYYEAADIFILPSLYNSFSTQILEALSYGCVCFTTDQNGASEILDTKFIIQNPNDQDIINYINTLLDNHSLMLEISAQNIDIAKEYTIDKNLNQILKIINENIH